MFSCKFVAYFQSIFSYENLRMAASKYLFREVCNTFVPVKEALVDEEAFERFFHASVTRI